MVLQALPEGFSEYYRKQFLPSNTNKNAFISLCTSQMNVMKIGHLLRILNYYQADPLFLVDIERNCPVTEPTHKVTICLPGSSCDKCGYFLSV